MVSERIIDLLEMVEVDGVDGELPAGRGQFGQRLGKFFGQVFPVREPGHGIVPGEELDLGFRALLFHGAAIPGGGGNGEGERRQQAQRYCRDQERIEEPVPHFGLIDIGRNDGDRPSVDEDGDIGFGEERWPLDRVAVLDRHDRLARGHGGGSGGIEFGQVDQCRSLPVGNELRVAPAVENLVAEHEADALRPAEERHAGGRRLLARRDLFQILHILGHVPRPVSSSRRGVPIQEMIGRELDRPQRPADQREKHQEDDAEAAVNRHLGPSRPGAVLRPRTGRPSTSLDRAESC